MSPGKQSKDCEANKYILFLQYKPSDILLHEWQHYGGESGKKAEFELESGRTRQAIRAFVDKNFADAGERIGKELDWSGDHVLLEDADANSDANSFGTRIICDLVRSAMAPEFARFDPKLAFPEVAFTVQMPTAIEEFTAWIATERGRKEAHAARDADAAKLLARHSDRARLIDVDLRGLIIRLLRASVLVSDEFIARILNIAQFEQEAGVVRDPAIQPEAKMPDRFEAALKQYLRNRSTPPGAVFTSLKDSELDYLGEPFRTQVAAAIKDFAQNAAAEEISVIMEAAFEGDKKAKLPLKRWIPEIPSVADLIKAFKTKALKAAYPSILTAKFITGKAQQMFNTRAREFAMRLAKEELQREIPSALEELVFGSTQDPDGMLDWAVSLHDLDFSSFLVRGTSIQSTFSLIDEVVSGCSGRLVEKHLSEHGWTWPAEPGCAHLKITREVRDEIQRRVTREVMHRIREAAKPCAITAFGPSVKYESDSTVHALLDRVYSGPIHVSSIWNEAVGERILQEVDLLRASYHLVEPISPEEVEEIAPQLGGPYRIILHDQAFAFISRRNQVIQLRQALANSRAAARKSAIDRAVTSCELADLESTDMPAKAFETIGIDDDADARKAWKESVEGRVRREFASAALSGVVSRESLQQRAPHLVSVAETLERLGLVRDVKYYCKCGFLSRQLGTRDRLMEHIRSSMCGEADILMK